MTGDLFPDSLETERLSLEELSRETIAPLDFYRILAHDDGIQDVTEYTPWDPHETPKETLDFLQLIEQERANYENAEWAVFPSGAENGAGDLAGVVGLELDWDRRMGHLGVWFRERFWGREYADEALSALLPLAFEQLELDLVAADVRTANRKSRRAFDKFVERHGGQLDGVFRNGWLDLDGAVHDKCRYSITREEWANAQSRQ